MFCYQCGAPVGEKDLFCGNCGARQEAAAPKLCPNCGTPYNDADVFCGGCGTRLNQPAAEPVPQQTIVMPIVEESVEEPVVLPFAEEAVEEPAAPEAPVEALVEEHISMEETQVFTAPVKTCPVCGTAVTDEDVFCGTCGTNLSAPEVVPAPVKTCPTCGTAVTDEDVFCGICGTNLSAPVQTAVPVQTVPPVTYAQEPVKPRTVAQQQAAPKKNRKTLLIVLLILIPLLIAGAVGAYLIITENNNAAAYNDAVALLEDRQYEKALEGFQALGSYRDSADQAKELEEMQDRYNVACDYLNAHEFDLAKDEFGALGDYRDSNEQYLYGVDYQKAMYLLRCAENNSSDGMAYIYGIYAEEDVINAQCYTGIDILTSLNGYQDSDDAITRCYRCLAYRYAELDNYDMALYCAESVGNEFYEEIHDRYMNTVADGIFLSAMEEVYGAWEDAFNSGYADKEEVIDIQLALLGAIDGTPFDDEILEDYYREYLEGLDQLKLVTDGYYITDYVIYYGVMADQYRIFLNLYQDYDFLQNAGIDGSYLEDVVDYYCAVQTIEQMLVDQLLGVSAEYDEYYDSYYITFRNKSEYSFNLWISLGFYLGNSNVSETDWYCVEVGAYETVEVPIYFEESEDWDTWYIYWDYDEVDY